MSSRLLQCLPRRNLLVSSPQNNDSLITPLKGKGVNPPLARLILKRRFHCQAFFLKRAMPVIPAVVANRHNLCLHTPLTLGNYCGSYGFYSGAHGCGAPMSSYSALSTPSKSPFFESKNGLLVGTARRNGILPDKRYYAKGKDKPKGKKAQVSVNMNEMNEVVDAEALKVALIKQVDLMKEDFTKNLSVRGSSGIEQLKVEFEGEIYPLQELAQVGRKNPQLAVLSLASLPDAIPAVLKAITDSGMNLNPQQEGTTIYLPLPKVTREHRETMAKNAKAIYIKYKTNLQAVQNKFIKQCKGQKDVSEDVSYSVQQQIMKLTERYIAELEGILDSKQKELLETL